jgi:hypothetical protein
MSHLMSKVPIRQIVRTRRAELPKGWKPGDAMNAIDSSTVPIWRYTTAKRQAFCVQQPQSLGTPDGHTRLWVSDFLSKEDDSLPEEYKRPYPAE